MDVSMYVYPNDFIQFEFYLFWFIRNEKPPGTSLKIILLPKIVHCLNELFYWSQIFCKFSAFSLVFQKFSRSLVLEQYFLTVSQNNFGNKISFPRGFVVTLFFLFCKNRFWKQDKQASAPKNLILLVTFSVQRRIHCKYLQGLHE